MGLKPVDVTLRYRFNDDNAASTPQGTGGSLTGDAIIRINITAANDMPLAVDDTHAVTEDGSNPVNGNALTGAGSPNTTADSDPENDVLTVTGIRTGSELAGGAFSAVAVGTTSANGRSVVGTYGTLVIGADGSYSYTLDNTNTAVNALNGGQTLTELFAYEMSDGTASDVAQITITINGSTDGAPAIVSVDDNGAAIELPAKVTAVRPKNLRISLFVSAKRWNAGGFLVCIQCFSWQNIIQHSLVHSVFFPDTAVGAGVAKYYSAFIRAFPDTAVGAGVAKKI